MELIETLAELVKPWARFYSKSDLAQAVVLFAHLGGVLWGGGLALSADRSVWRLRTASAEERARLLVEIGRMHKPILAGLGVAALSGVLLLLADIETYGPSPWFWGKMAGFSLLLINGRWLQVHERRMQAKAGMIPTGWSALTVASAASMTLWFAVVLGGVLLMNV
jgi:hypothetical protein